jgi:hypothetical protein
MAHLLGRVGRANCVRVAAIWQLTKCRRKTASTPVVKLAEVAWAGQHANAALRDAIALVEWIGVLLCRPLPGCQDVAGAPRSGTGEILTPAVTLARSSSRPSAWNGAALISSLPGPCWCQPVQQRY